MGLSGKKGYLRNHLGFTYILSTSDLNTDVRREKRRGTGGLKGSDLQCLGSRPVSTVPDMQ